MLGEGQGIEKIILPGSYVFFTVCSCSLHISEVNPKVGHFILARIREYPSRILAAISRVLFASS